MNTFSAHWQSMLQACILGLRAECNAWLEDLDLLGNDVANQPVADRNACLAFCRATPSCNAMTFNQVEKICWTKNIQDDEPPVEDTRGITLRLCDDDLDIPAADIPVIAALASEGVVLVCIAGPVRVGEVELFATQMLYMRLGVPMHADLQPVKTFYELRSRSVLSVLVLENI